MRTPIAALALLAASACNALPPKGPPARLAADASDTIVVNNLGPVPLRVRVLDASGHALADTGVRFRFVSGAPLALSPTGSATCTDPGDATVRASLGSLVTTLLVRCRPVRDVRAAGMLNLVVGAPARALPFEAVGVDGRPVELLAGEATVGDSAIATLDGLRVRARAPGATEVTIRVGDRRAFVSVHAYGRARTLERLRAGEHAAVPVHLAGAEMRRLRLPASPELYYVAMLPDGDERRMPGVAVAGARCTPALPPRSWFCLARRGASVIVYHPEAGGAARELSGMLAVWRQGSP